MDYIEIKKGIVVNIFCGPLVPEGMTEVRTNHQYCIGDNIKFFKNDLRITPDEASVFLKPKKDESVIWRNGKYICVKDYTGKEFWDKKTKKQIQFKIEQVPDETMTDQKPSDYAEEWTEAGWVIPEEVKAERVRVERNIKLAETDFLLMPDYPLKNKKPLEEYRQALRDIPQQKGFPKKINWPEAP